MNEWKDIEKKILEDSEKMGMDFQEEYWNDMEAMLDKEDDIVAAVAFNEANGLNSEGDGLFQEEYWDEMSLILDQEDRKNRRALWLKWTFDIAAALLLTFTLSQYNSSPISDTIDLHLTELTDSAPSIEKTTEPKELIDNTSKTNSPIESTQIAEQAGPTEFAGTFEKRTLNVNPTKSDSPIQNSLATNDTKSTIVPTSGTKLEERSELELSLKQERSLQASSLATKPLQFSPGNVEIVKNENLAKLLPRRNVLLPLSVNLVASSNIALAPEGNVSNQSRIGSNNSIGIEVLKHSVNWSYGVGVDFSHRTGLNHELKRTKSTYGARLYREYQTVKYNSFGSIGIPVGVNYHRKRDVFGIRITPTWNVMVNSTYHRYNNYNSDELLVKNNYGIKDGINPFDLRLKLMYQRRLTENLAVGVNVSAGFFNQIDPTVITNSTGMKEFSVGLNVSYTLFKR